VVLTAPPGSMPCRGSSATGSAARARATSPRPRPGTRSWPTTRRASSRPGPPTACARKPAAVAARRRAERGAARRRRRRQQRRRPAAAGRVHRGRAGAGVHRPPRPGLALRRGLGAMAGLDRHPLGA
jgi:hypothetical protein